MITNYSRFKALMRWAGRCLSFRTHFRLSLPKSPVHGQTGHGLNDGTGPKLDPPPILPRSIASKSSKTLFLFLSRSGFAFKHGAPWEYWLAALRRTHSTYASDRRACSYNETYNGAKKKYRIRQRTKPLFAFQFRKKYIVYCLSKT